MLALFYTRTMDDFLVYYSPIQYIYIYEYRSEIYVFIYTISRDITQLVRVKNF